MMILSKLLEDIYFIDRVGMYNDIKNYIEEKFKSLNYSPDCDNFISYYKDDNNYRLFYEKNNNLLVLDIEMPGNIIYYSGFGEMSFGEITKENIDNFFNWYKEVVWDAFCISFTSNSGTTSFTDDELIEISEEEINKLYKRMIALPEFKDNQEIHTITITKENKKQTFKNINNSFVLVME
jgi:hypothetical protein